MMKTYDVTCPDSPFCGEEFEVVDLDPATEEDCIECPHCGQEFDWEHDPAADIVTLLRKLRNDDEEGEDVLLGDLEDEDEDEEE